jgi:hypothetical protein
MGGLEELFGGDLAKSLGGLIEQFEGGTAHQVSGEDAVAHHDAVAKRLSPKDYEQAAIDAAAKLTPAQRKELAAKLTEVAQQKGHPVAAAPQHGNEAPSADAVGKLMAGLQGSGGLTSVAEGLLGNPTVRSALVGVATSAAKRLL